MATARNRSGVLMLCIAFVFGAPWMMWVARGDYRADMAAWAALASAPTATYAVAGRHTEERGGGRSRRTHHFLHLTLTDRAAAALPSLQVEVSAATFRDTADGQRWRARLRDGQPQFDPLQTRLSLQKSRTASIATLILVPLGLLLFWLHRSGRLYRSL